MSITANPATSRRFNIWRIVGWGGAVALVLAPLVAMQFTNEVNWDETDFIFAAVIFGIVGGLIELTVRKSANWYFRFGSMFAVLAGFMAIWSNLAVGMIGNEDNPVNLWFGAVLLIAIGGSVVSRFRANIMPSTIFAAGTVQVAIGTFAGVLGTDMRGGIFTIVLSAAWFISAILLHRAGKGRS
jgi:hypothetical protein